MVEIFVLGVGVFFTPHFPEQCNYQSELDPSGEAISVTKNMRGQGQKKRE